ncbi:MAG: hypothetical protein ACREVW_18220 [Burkholderiales bacterium]
MDYQRSPGAIRADLPHVGFREAVTEIGFKLHVLHQPINLSIEVFIVGIRKCQIVFALVQLLHPKLLQVKILDVLARALFAADEFTVVLDAKPKSDGGRFHKTGSACIADCNTVV